MAGLVRRALFLGVLMAVLIPGTAQAGIDVFIDINPSPGSGVYSPNPASAAVGYNVAWVNNTALPHSSTGNAPLSLWDTGTFGQGDAGIYRFATPGTFGYHCSVHPDMVGTMNVPMTVSPTSGTANVTVFTLQWANPSIPNGFNVDIQYRRNGGAWTNLLVNRTGSQVMIQRTAPAPGTYDLRARTQRTSNGAASAYSPPVTAVVS